MLRTVAFASAGVLLSATAALACDQHGSLTENRFLAYLDTRGMTEAEIRVAEQKAIDAYHAEKLALARAAFLNRFTVIAPAPTDDAAPADPQTGQGTDQVADDDAEAVEVAEVASAS